MSNDELEGWGTETLRRLAKTIGREATMQLVYACGGIGTYIPREPRASHAWAAALGPEAWAKVVAEFGGERVDLPLGAYMYRLRKREIIELAEQGCSHREIAQRVRTTERYVRRVLHEIDFPRIETADPRQTKFGF